MKNCKFLLLTSLIGILSSCQDETMPIDYDSFVEEIAATRANYDNGYVEWDNVETLSCIVNGSTLNLTVPWASGSAHSQGIPAEWIDQNYRSSTASNRMYSHVNGWEMVYSNLKVSAQFNKYFALYNKYTGIMRFFFYKTVQGGEGTSTTAALIQVHNSSLMNFTYENPQPMDFRPSYANFTYVPKGNIVETQLNGVEFMSNQWYGLEFECAYDSSNTNATMAAKLNGANVIYMDFDGSTNSDITGNISTTYSSSSSSNYTLNMSFGNNNSVTVKNSYDNTVSGLSNKIDDEVNNKHSSFFTNLWQKIQNALPSGVSNGIDAGIEALFTGGASYLVNTAGKLVNSLLGLGSSNSIKSSLSEVKLKTDGKFTGTAVSSITYGGWGEITAMPLPGSGSSSNLYNTTLGVWNISTTPRVKVNLLSNSYFTGNDPTLGIGDIPMAADAPMYVTGTVPYNWTTNYTMTLQSFNVVINPALLSSFTLQNVHKELVFTNDLLNVNTKTVYGLNNNIPLYSYGSSYSSVSSTETKPYIVKTDYDPETSFDTTWTNKVTQATNNMYCRVSFELRNNSTGQIMAYSKYFKVQAYKGTHTHRDYFLN